MAVEARQMNTLTESQPGKRLSVPLLDILMIGSLPCPHSPLSPPPKYSGKSRQKIKKEEGGNKVIKIKKNCTVKSVNNKNYKHNHHLLLMGQTWPKLTTKNIQTTTSGIWSSTITFLCRQVAIYAGQLYMPLSLPPWSHGKPRGNNLRQSRKIQHQIQQRQISTIKSVKSNIDTGFIQLWCV